MQQQSCAIQIQEHLERYMHNTKEANIRLIPVGVSNRHIHLCKEDMESLFGMGYELTKMKDLLQKGEYAANETLVIAGPKGAITKVRVLGPLRQASQAEILISDGFVLGITPPVRDSGNREPSPALTLIGPAGSVTLCAGVIAAWRHIHLGEDEARRLAVANGESVCVRIAGDRGAILDNVKIRVGNFSPEFHLDIEEANATGLRNDMLVELLLSDGTYTQPANAIKAAATGAKALSTVALEQR